MVTCKSPRTVLLWAYHLGQQTLEEYSSKFSRHDFTLPQLFACLTLREHQKKSYRGIEALLKDCPEWCAAIGMKRAPDHNTLCRAFGVVSKLGNTNRMLDLQSNWARTCDMVQSDDKPASMDSSMFESHHVSRHFEKRCKQTRRDERKKSKNQLKMQGNRRRSRTVKRLPKLSLAVSSKSHLILAARATTGAGADQPHFGPLLSDAKRRVNIKIIVADAGYDSEANHSIARDDLEVRSIIPPNNGRPTNKPPPTRHRRNMYHRFKRKADRPLYGQRWQSETVNSMIKRNLGSALRARTARRRSRELMLRVVTHNLMIFRRVWGR
jgi:Transposase DDE domain